MKKTIFLLLVSVSLSACSLLPEPYKTPVSQGNVLKQEQVAQVKVGMSASQVSYLLGTPMVRDSFAPNEWHYLYTSLYADNNTKKSEVDHLVLIFDNDILKTIEQR
jgi:outer membrane protein assembly factor BamE